MNAPFRHAMKNTLTHHDVVLAGLLVIVYVYPDMAYGVDANYPMARTNGANVRTGQDISPCAITQHVASQKRS